MRKGERETQHLDFLRTNKQPFDLRKEKQEGASRRTKHNKTGQGEQLA
jgi:hypothetical protein